MKKLTLEEFKNYKSKPIVRVAYEIKDEVAYWPDKSEAEVRSMVFKCFQEPKVGDFIVFLSDIDTYHVARDVFLARNIVPLAEG